MSFGLTSPGTKSAWPTFAALAQLEGVLKSGGFPLFPPVAYTNMHVVLDQGSIH
jgi:hypothetical protein